MNVADCRFTQFPNTPLNLQLTSENIEIRLLHEKMNDRLLF
jgi:hypothetical protein